MQPAQTQTAYELHASVVVRASEPLTRKLFERRITSEVIATFQIESYGDGWKYPTPGGGLRWKNANSQASNKYAWIGDKRDTLLYRFDIAEAVKTFEFSIWLVTEFDVFAMQSANISNVIGQLSGEGNVPDNLPAFLESLGVVVCYIAPDKDKAGDLWAQKVTDILAPHGIEVIIKRLPDHLGESADIGKAWQVYNGKRSFYSYLLDLETTRLLPRLPKWDTNQSDYQVIPTDDLKSDVLRALGIKSFKSSGWSNNISCPFKENHKHGDKNSSASVHKDTGLNCLVPSCGFHGWRLVAERLGIEYRGTTLAIPAPSRPMLADETINAMIAAGYRQLARATSQMYAAGWEVGKVITISDIANLLSSDKTARIISEQMRGRKPDKRKQNSRPAYGRSPHRQEDREAYFLPRITPIFSLNYLSVNSGKKINKGQKGRKKIEFRVPSPDELAKAFDVTPRNYSEVKLDVNKKIVDWCAEVLAVRIDKQAGEYSVSELGKPTKISPSTVRAYKKRAGINSRRNYDRIELNNVSILTNTPEKGHLETDDGRKFRATKEGYSRALQHGGKIYLVRYLKSTYWRNNTEYDKSETLEQIEGTIKTLEVVERESPILNKPAMYEALKKYNWQTANYFVERQKEKIEEMNKAWMDAPKTVREKIGEDYANLVNAYVSLFGEKPSARMSERLQLWQYKMYDATYGRINGEWVGMIDLEFDDMGKTIKTIIWNYSDNFNWSEKYVSGFGEITETLVFGVDVFWNSLSKYHNYIAHINDDIADLLEFASSMLLDKLNEIILYVGNKKDIGNKKAYVCRAIENALEQKEREEIEQENLWTEKVRINKTKKAQALKRMGKKRALKQWTRKAALIVVSVKKNRWQHGWVVI